MRRHEYLVEPEIIDFISWIEERLDTANSFIHSYKMKKPAKIWSCDSVYSAYENYSWPFRCKHPEQHTPIEGNSYHDSYEVLTMLSAGLRKSIDGFDNEMCQKYCFSILEWGGVLNQNDKRIVKLGNDVCCYFKDTRDRFQSDLSCDQYYDKGLIMNSGFTKLYSLSIDDFIIYDGRVGAALGLLVGNYCKEKGFDELPETLSFAWGKGRESNSSSTIKNRRDPSDDCYTFPQLSNNPRRHTENNVKANWLLQGIITTTSSKFSLLDQASQLRALEAALFMIGYCVN